MRGDIRRLNASSFFFRRPLCFCFSCSCLSLLHIPGGERPVPRGSQTTAGLQHPGTNGYTKLLAQCDRWVSRARGSVKVDKGRTNPSGPKGSVAIPTDLAQFVAKWLVGQPDKASHHHLCCRRPCVVWAAAGTHSLVEALYARLGRPEPPAWRSCLCDGTVPW